MIYQNDTFENTENLFAVAVKVLLEWIRRNENDQKTYGELFFMLCDDIQDMNLTTALKSLMALFVEHLNHYREYKTG